MGGLKHPQKIFAVFVFFAIASCVVAAAYWSYHEIPIDVDDGQWQLRELQGYPEAADTKSYKVVLESLDDTSGTVHLRAELHMPPKEIPLFYNHVEERFMTDEIRKHRIPAQVLFGPFEIIDRSEIFPLYLGWTQGWFSRGPTNMNPTANYSEVAPVSTQADVFLTGAPWLYPFDKYLITAEVRCIVLATPDRKQYFRIQDDGYYLVSKIPNMLIRNAKAKDVEYWRKKLDPYYDPKTFAHDFKADGWRNGAIVLVLERPLFPKFLTAFFGMIALVWLGFLAFVSDPKQLSLNAVGYFLAIWAIRAPLAAGAPKVDTLLLDYVTLGLYALLVAVVLAKFIWGFRKT
jgi:hypothetical protein